MPSDRLHRSPQPFSRRNAVAGDTRDIAARDDNLVPTFSPDGAECRSYTLVGMPTEGASGLMAACDNADACNAFPWRGC
jgi:hypothetical protein